MRLLTHYPQTKVFIFFNIPCNKMLGCFTQFQSINHNFHMELLIDTVLSYSTVRSTLEGSKIPFSKFIDEYYDGEEVPEEIGSYLFMQYQIIKNRGGF